MTATGEPAAAAAGPKHAPLVLVTLILAAAVADRNLAGANVALPTTGRAFDASQAELHLIAVRGPLGYAAVIIAALAGAVIVFFFPRRAREGDLLPAATGRASPPPRPGAR